jgi:hypothetical protein
MARRTTLVNTGNEDNSEGNSEQEVGGFAEGTLEHMQSEGEASPADSPQDIADQEAAGIPNRPTRPTAHTSGAAANTRHSDGNGSNRERPVSPKAQYNALKSKVQKLGEQLGGSKTSMIALAEAVTEAAQDDTITVEQVPEIYERFKAGVSKASTYEDAGEVSDDAAMGMAPAKSIEQQLSKLRQFVNLGSKYTGDALDLVRKARNMHIELLRAANNATNDKDKAELKKGIKPGSTYSVLVDVARAQLKKNKDAMEAAKQAKAKHTLAPVLTDVELRDLMTQEVKEAVDKTGEDYLLDTLIKARATYKGSDKRNAITCEELVNAIEWLRAAMAKVAPDALAKYDADEQKAIDDREKAKADKIEAERLKTEKANEPKPSKAERQAGLATPAQQGEAQPVA